MGNNRLLETCPCKGCEDRKVGCHSECLKYKDWAYSYKEISKDLKERKHIDTASYSSFERK